MAPATTTTDRETTGNSTKKTIATPTSMSKPLRSRLRSADQKTRNVSSHRKKSGISNISQKPSKTFDPNRSDHAAALQSLFTPESTNAKLRTARDHLRSSEDLSTPTSKKKLEAIKGLLRTLDRNQERREKSNKTYDREIYDDVQSWLHVRENPLQAGNPHPAPSSEPAKPAPTTHRGMPSPLSANHHTFITPTANALLSPTSTHPPTLPTRKEAMAAWTAKFQAFVVEARNNPDEYPEYSGDMAIRLFIQKFGGREELPETYDAAMVVLGELADRDAGVVVGVEGNAGEEEVGDEAGDVSGNGKGDADGEEVGDEDVEVETELHDVGGDRAMPAEMMEFSIQRDAHLLASDDEEAERRMTKGTGKEHFLFGETTHLQGLIGQQIEEDLVAEINEDGDLAKEVEPKHSMSAMEMFALPEAREEDVRVARGCVERQIEEAGFVISDGKVKWVGDWDGDGDGDWDEDEDEDESEDVDLVG